MSKNKKQSRGIYTLEEIRTQPKCWPEAIQKVENSEKKLGKMWENAEEIIFSGCGSGFNVSCAVAPYAQMVSGKTCRPAHASDLVVNPECFFSKKRRTLAVVISRSGQTTESALALQAAKKHGAVTVALVCFGDSAMAKTADVPLVLEKAQEKSVTTTRSLTAMILAGYYLAEYFSGTRERCSMFKRLPDMALKGMEKFEELGRRISNDAAVKKYAFLGTGPYYGLAREAQLKVKEMVLLPSDSYVSLDYQHGPMSNVDKNMLVAILTSDAGRKYDAALAGNMKKLGGKVFALCDKAAGGLGKNTDYLLELKTGLPDGIRDVLYMPALQFMAYYKSLAVGCDPDNPRNLSYYVALNKKGVIK